MLWGTILFITPPSIPNLWIAFILKAMGAGVLAFVTSIGTLLGKYVVEHRKQISDRIFKRKQNGKRKNDKAA